jgi:AraC family transcriptional regulator, regulatory protein of adaptative response / methylphosphotriester-DNA alkyltransferase methyltransferase
MALRPLTVQERRRIWDGATTYIRAHYAHPLDVDEVARAAFTSRRQLQRVFGEVGQTTFREYVCKVRMHVAARHLAEASSPVRLIADSVGYRQPAQFAKAFRRRYGVGPSEFRARYARPAGAADRGAATLAA